METRHDFQLNFLTNRNELKSLNIPHANNNATGVAVSNAMQRIIDTGIVQSARGEPLFRYGANLITTESRDFNILT